MKTRLVLAMLGAMLLPGAMVRADSLYLGSGPGGRSASADFALSGNTLTVELKNTATAAAGDPTYVLSAVFFSYTGASTDFTAKSAAISSGSTVLALTGSLPSNYNATTGDVGAEWAYKGGLTSPAPAAYGISSAGFNLFGGGDVFPNTTGNLSGPASPDGIQFGILPGGITPTPSTNLTGTNANVFIEGGVDFKFTVAAGFALGKISNVQFQYGTSTADTTYGGIVVTSTGQSPGAPLPAAVASGALLFGGLLTRRRIGTLLFTA